MARPQSTKKVGVIGALVLFLAICAAPIAEAGRVTFNDVIRVLDSLGITQGGIYNPPGGGGPSSTLDDLTFSIANPDVKLSRIVMPALVGGGPGLQFTDPSGTTFRPLKIGRNGSVILDCTSSQLRVVNGTGSDVAVVNAKEIRLEPDAVAMRSNGTSYAGNSGPQWTSGPSAVTSPVDLRMIRTTTRTLVIDSSGSGNVAIVNSGTLTTLRSIESKTSNYVMTDEDTFKVFDNEGTAAATVVTFTLPGSNPGLQVTINRDDADGGNVEIDPLGSDRIMYSGGLMDPGEKLILTQVGSSVTLVCKPNGTWRVISEMGTLQEETP